MNTNKLKMLLISSLVISIVLVITTFTQQAYAYTGLEHVASGTVIGSEVFDYEQDDMSDSSSLPTDYPAAFDLRNVDGKCYSTSVKLQSPWGTCWGFGAIAAAESSIIASGLSDENIDLSERHLAYFNASYLDDPGSPQNGEGVHLTGTKKKFDAGGNEGYASILFASGIGPTQESNFPYRGNNSEVEKRRAATEYDKDGNPTKYEYIDYSYSEDDDWSVPETERFGQSYRLKDSLILPSPNGKDENRKYKYIEAGTDAIKEQIAVHHRAVSIAYRSESVKDYDFSNTTYMSDNWAQYTYDSRGASHVVTIVGYDDNYPKENFKEGHQPEADGAFLIKNSWGSDLNDFPNNGYRHFGLLEGMDGIPYDPNATATSHRSTGYFWLSYYDHSLKSAEAFEFDTVTGENGYYLEQHDLMTSSSVGDNTTPRSKMANVFQAGATGELSGFSVLTTNPGTTAEYEIYLLQEKYDGPEDGIKIASGSADFKYGGYHKIILAKEDRTIIPKGQNYSVIVNLKADSSDYVSFKTGYREGGDMVALKGYYHKAVINKGESYYYNGQKWYDLSNEEPQKALIGENYDSTVMDNFPIKSYLEPVVISGDVFNGYLLPKFTSSDAVGSYTMKPDNEVSLTAIFRGMKTEGKNIDTTITWSSSDPKVFTVTPDTENDTKAVIKSVAIGTAYLTIDAGSYGKRVVGINVEDTPQYRLPNPIKVKAKTASVKYSTLKKKSLKLAVKKVLTVKEAEGAVTYTKKSGSSKIKIAKSTGKVTVKKGLKKGTYKVRVKVNAAGDRFYAPGSKTVTFKVKVK